MLGEIICAILSRIKNLFQSKRIEQNAGQGGSITIIARDKLEIDKDATISANGGNIINK